MSQRIPRSLRSHVRQRAGHCCEYCLIHEDDCIYPHEPDHPRSDQWSDHFQLVNGLIAPLTSTGRATAFLLQFNRTDLVAARRLLLADGRYPRR